MIKHSDKKEYLRPLLMGFILSAILIIPAIIEGGGILYLTNDFSTQQLPFYVLCHKALKSGSLYSHLTGLGNSLIESYSFYTLGSPFFLFTLLFDSSTVVYLMGPLLIVKFTLSALTGYIYIRPYLKNSDTALIGSLLYAFSGYQIFNIFYNHFEDVCVVAPLLLWALDRLMEDRYRGLFGLFVALNAFVNYVFFVGTVIFVIIYFILMVMLKEYKITAKRILTIAFESVFGLAITSVILLPSVFYLLFNNRVSSIISGINMIVFSSPQRYWEILRAMFIPPDTPHISPFIIKSSGSVWNSPALYLPVFGVSSVIGIFFHNGNKFFKRITAVMAVMMFIPVLNALFSALNATYYARWFYFPVLIMALITAYTLDNEEYNECIVKGSFISFLFVAVFSLICLFCPVTDSTGKISIGLYRNGDIYHTLFYISLTLISLSAVIYILKIKIPYTYVKRLFLLFVSVNIILYGTVNITTMCACYGNSDTYKENFIDGIDLLSDGDDSYRIDTTQVHYNVHMWWEKQSIATFNSTISTCETEYYSGIGYSRYVATMPNETYYSTRYLTSVRYAFYDTDDYCILPGFVPIGTYGGFSVYENPYYIPMGFYYNNYISESELSDYPKLSPGNLMLKGIILNDEQIKKYHDILGQVRLSDIYPGTLNAVQASEDAMRLSSHGGKSFKWLENGFVSEVNLRTDNLIFYSVPYDKGFTAYVDGKETEIEKVNFGFMAVLVPKGKHTVEFKFKTVGLHEGILVSAVSGGVYTSYIFLSVGAYVLNRRKRKNQLV